MLFTQGNSNTKHDIKYDKSINNNETEMNLKYNKKKVGLASSKK